MKEFEKQLSLLIQQGRALQQTHKDQIEINEDVETDIDVGLRSLEDALKKYQETPDEEDDSDDYETHCAMEGRMSRFV